MNTITTKPSAVIVSSSSTKPKSLIKLITRSNEIVEEHPHRISTNWLINTKYYTANIDVHGITDEFERDDNFNSTVEALIVHVDTNRESGLGDLQKWEQIEKDCNPEIKLLVANYCTNETKISKGMAIDWCLSRGYELIELYPDNKNVQVDKDEIILEKFGVERIIEALQVHTWPNLEMKDAKGQEKLNKEEQKETIKDEKDTDESEASASVKKDMSDLLSGIDDCMSEMDDFADLFSKLQSMKESIQSLPDRDRKKQAEELVTMFWRTIGGDEDEIDLSDI